ncbi:Ltp family lipoprotein [Corynebacterium stationis]|uniref:Putative host cell surface-exposed lipoprotein Ltp-like HTH region domain-containing protein n=1 Tax=Corynebacterium stationis TaxID=1705 RepID=A0AB36CJH1_9CORY|nr:Ltp family lipoprotein [Corynebacterium stationis]NME88611.1 hypothetical protein [Corynebacterium stationis]
MSGPNYEQQPQADYSTQSYAEYQESLKQNAVFASDRKPEKKQKKSGGNRNKIIAIAAMVIVIGGAIGFNSVWDSEMDEKVQDGITDGISGAIDEGSNRINELNASTDGELALIAAREALEQGHYSESELAEYLTSPYGEVYTDQAAQYALDNIDADWNAEALESAESYLRHSHYSYEGLHHQLSAESADNFTDAQARYAVDNVEADWDAEAVEAAESYWSNDNIDITPDELRDILVSDTIGRFTDQQADHALAELGIS